MRRLLRRARSGPGTALPLPASPARSLHGELRASGRLLAGVLAVLLLTVTVSAGYLLAVLEPRVASTNAIVHELRCMQTSMRDQETGLRAYLSTGDIVFLRPSNLAQAQQKTCEPQLLRSAADDAVEVQLAVALVIAANEWEQGWAKEARTGVPGSNGASLTPFLLSGKALFDAYRAAEDAAVNRAVHQRDASLRAQHRLGAATAVSVLAFVIVLLLVDLRRRRRLSRVIATPVGHLLDAVERIQRGELGVQRPDCEVAEFAQLGEGLFSIARRLEREHAQGMLREETAQRLAGRLQVVLRVAREAAGAPTPETVAEMVAGAALELGRVQSVVWLRDDDDELTAVCTGSRGETPPTKLPEDVRRTAVEARLVRVGGHACFPFVVSGRVVGVLEVRDEAWDDEDTAQVDSVLEALARLAAVTVESARLHAQTIEQARVDALTGLRNRRSMDSEFPVEFARARRYDRPLSIALLDLDHFKRVNDTAGHAVGDEWLRLVGGLVLGRLRTSDSAFRYGGEELVVLLPETDGESAFVVADRLREAVAACHGPAAYAEMTVSIGLATATFEMKDEQDLLRAADAALYEAKAAGRNQVVAAAALAPPPSLRGEAVHA